jgi:hypothetical protein
MRFLLTVSAFLMVGAAAFADARAADETKDIFDYEAQKAAPDDVVKIVFIGDAGTHGPTGNHEFVAGSIYLARTLNEAHSNVHAVVHSTNNWPTDLSHADAVIVALNHGGRAAVDPEIFSAVRKGAGFMAIHYGVEVNKGEQGDNYLKWMGGYFETFWSVNPSWTPQFETIPEHPTTRGVRPFSVEDEWYYHMRFAPEMRGVTPILSATAPLSTVAKEPSERGGNADVHAAVSKGEPQHVAWAYERPEGGRGFGFTGFHRYANLENDDFRQLLVNAAAWVSGLDIPEDGVSSPPMGEKELKELVEEAHAWVAGQEK